MITQQQMSAAQRHYDNMTPPPPVCDECGYVIIGIVCEYDGVPVCEECFEELTEREKK